MGKLGNVAAIFKKGNIQLIKKYRSISFLPVYGKILEKIIFNNLYTYLHTNKLITEINQPTNYYNFLMKSIRLLMALIPLKISIPSHF